MTDEFPPKITQEQLEQADKKWEGTYERPLSVEDLALMQRELDDLAKHRKMVMKLMRKATVTETDTLHRIYGWGSMSVADYTSKGDRILVRQMTYHERQLTIESAVAMGPTEPHPGDVPPPTEGDVPPVDDDHDDELPM